MSRINTAVILGIAVLAVACTRTVSPVPTSQPETSLPTNLPPTVQPTRTAEVLPTVSVTVETATDMKLPAGVLAALRQIAQQLKTTVDRVTLISYEEVQWRDSCLGVQLPDEMCLQVITPGYRVIVKLLNQQYEFHTTLKGDPVVKAIPAVSGVRHTVLTWKRTTPECQTVSIGLDAMDYSTCDSNANTIRLTVPSRAIALRYYIATYASFDADTPSGHVIFTGVGEQIATPTEQRMFAEYAQVMYQGAASGQDSTSADIAVFWHREGGIVGFCDDVTISIYGRVQASSCKGGATRELGTTWLTLKQLDALYGWVDQHISYNEQPPISPKPDELVITVQFTGRGQQAASAETSEAMHSLGQSLLQSIVQK